MPKFTDWKAVRKDLQKFLSLEMDFVERFKTARLCRAKLRRDTTAAVVRSEWFTDLCHELDPTFFILGLREEKPGNQLKREPSSKIGKVRYGYDTKNRLVQVEKCMAWDEYREHRPGRIDAMRFHLWEKNCLDIQTLFLDRRQPAVYIKSDNKWLEIKKYERQGGKIVRVFTASKQIAVADSKWRFGKYEIFEKRYGVYDIRIELDNYKPGDSSMLLYFAPVTTDVKDKERWKMRVECTPGENKEAWPKTKRPRKREFASEWFAI
jgi:hypothetical protein